MLETLALIAFIVAILFVAFTGPKRTDENKKDSDSDGK